MFIIEKTDVFDAWRESFEDKQACSVVALRLERLVHGHFGDVKQVGGV